MQAAGRRGFSVLRARGSELESPFAFGLVRQLFEPILARAGAPGRERLLAGAALLCEPLFGAALEPADAELGLRRLHGLYWLCANLSAERPLLLAVDDLQWADASSLRFVAYLGARLGELPVALVGGLRSGERPALLGDMEAETIRPSPLTPGGIDGLARHVLGQAPAPALVARCGRETGGIPFLAIAFLRGDAPLSDWVERRLERLGPAPTRLCRAVAILGDHAELRHAAALAGTTTGLADRDALCAAGILEPGLQ